jgi:formiminoglutamase
MALEKFTNYTPGQPEHWTGRKTNPAIGNQYWYQEIVLKSAEKRPQEKIDIGLLGYASDEGVRRNQGRIGAAQGPDAIRGRLAKMPFHLGHKKVADFGNVFCLVQDMESCQNSFSNHISRLIQQQIFPIGFGGGHDMAYAHFIGIRDAIKDRTNKRIGIVNFDAHFDLRPVEEQPNSGTPFNQIIHELKQTNEAVGYYAIGIQDQSNTKELYEIAKREGVNYTSNYDCAPNDSNLSALQQKMLPFIGASDYLYVTIDLDGFSSAYAPGVSAPSPMGFSPFFVVEMLRFLFETNKVISCDIAELNPLFDRDGTTALLAARLVDFMAAIK